jgi:hypothetical protein
VDPATACDGLATVAFGAGIILNSPGIWHLGALEDISGADEGTAATILWIVFAAIVFMLAEVHSAGYALSPDGTPVRVTQLRRVAERKWSENRHLGGGAMIGVYATVKGSRG